MQIKNTRGAITVSYLKLGHGVRAAKGISISKSSTSRTYLSTDVRYDGKILSSSKESTRDAANIQTVKDGPSHIVQNVWSHCVGTRNCGKFNFIVSILLYFIIIFY
jgi:hypothetical protein